MPRGNTMAMGIELDKRDVRIIQKMLRDLPAASQRRVLRPAITQGIKPIRKSIKRRAGQVKDTGQLFKSIGVKIKSYTKGNTVVGISGPRLSFKGKDAATGQNPANYAHLLEFGTDPHTIEITDKNGITRTVQHPGAEPHPFIRPAIDENGAKVSRIMRRVVGEGLPKEAKRLALRKQRGRRR